MDKEDKLLIRDLTVKTKKGYLTAKVMRKWPYDGNIPGGPVIYIGLVLADEEGKAIYAQISQSEIHRLDAVLELDQVYTFRKFNVRVCKPNYVPFDADLMIYLTSFSTVTPSKVPVDAFPKIIYNITSFDNIKTTGDDANKYIDVIGILTAEQLPKTACPRGKDYILNLKELTIKDLSDREITVTLWEEHIQQFQLPVTSSEEQPHSVVALFCGCLPKTLFNKTHVNAGRACRWFLNPDIKEAQPFYASLKVRPVPIYRPVAQASSLQPPPEPKVMEHKNLIELNQIDPYLFPEQGCKCTVTVLRIPPEQEWWYMGCVACKRRLHSQGGLYYCGPCKSSKAVPMYKFSFVAGDDTAEARFFAYDVVARQIIRRNCGALLASIDHAPGLPQRILGVIGKTYIFGIGLTNESYQNMDSRCYLVESCVLQPQQQLPPPPAPLPAQQLPATPPTLLLQAPPASVPQETPPPSARSQETPLKEDQAPSGTSSKHPMLSHDNVRKRLFGRDDLDDEENSDEDHGDVKQTEDMGKKPIPALITDKSQKLDGSNVSKTAPGTQGTGRKRAKAT